MKKVLEAGFQRRYFLAFGRDVLKTLIMPHL
jgi:hypothetical protein